MLLGERGVSGGVSEAGPSAPHPSTPGQQAVPRAITGRWGTTKLRMGCVKHQVQGRLGGPVG